eukprot:366366-Chlamydomonas_euryale.AAC.20
MPRATSSTTAVIPHASSVLPTCRHDGRGAKPACGMAWPTTGGGAHSTSYVQSGGWGATHRTFCDGSEQSLASLRRSTALARVSSMPDQPRPCTVSSGSSSRQQRHAPLHTAPAAPAAADGCRDHLCARSNVDGDSRGGEHSAYNQSRRDLRTDLPMQRLAAGPHDLGALAASAGSDHLKRLLGRTAQADMRHVHTSAHTRSCRPPHHAHRLFSLSPHTVVRPPSMPSSIRHPQLPSHCVCIATIPENTLAFVALRGCATARPCTGRAWLFSSESFEPQTRFGCQDLAQQRWRFNGRHGRN